MGDYGVTIHVPENEAQKAIVEAEEFLDVIQKILEDGDTESRGRPQDTTNTE